MVSERSLPARGPSAIALAVALLWTAVVYRPILGAYFFADDFGNLFQVVNGDALEYILEPSPGHVIYVPHLCYLLLYRVFGPEPRAFFASVLLTHLVNVALLFAFVRRLTRSAMLAGLAAALWGTLRINEGTLGWYAVYGQVFATTTVLVVLLRLAQAVDRGAVSTREVLAWCTLLLLGTVSFGSAVPVAFVLPVIVWLVLPRTAVPATAWRVLWALPVVLPLAYAAVYGLYVLAYGHDDKQAPLLFSLMWKAAPYSVLMTAHLFRAGTLALITGVEALPAFTSIASYALPAAAVLALAAAVRWSPPVVRRWFAMLLLLTAAIYVFIALGRVFVFYLNPAAGAWTPRYHYLPTLLLTVVAALVLRRAALAIGRPEAVAAALFAIWLAVASVLWSRGDWVIDQHANMRAMTEGALARIHRIIATTPGDGPVIIPNQPFQPSLATPYEIGGLAGLFSIYRPPTGGRDVRFADSRPEVLAKARPGTPLAALLVPADAATP